MKKIIIPILIFLFLSLPAFACLPCLETLNLEETAERADLIIVGQRTKDSLSSNSGKDLDIDGVRWIEIKVIKTLKGEIDKKIIRVGSFYGMCFYGIIINDNENYIIFLEKNRDGEYGSIEAGCSTTTLLIENDSDVDKLVAELGLELSQTRISKNNLFTYLLILIIILFILIFLGLKLMKRKKT